MVRSVAIVLLILPLAFSMGASGEALAASCEAETPLESVESSESVAEVRSARKVRRAGVRRQRRVDLSRSVAPPQAPTLRVSHPLPVSTEAGRDLRHRHRSLLR